MDNGVKKLGCPYLLTFEMVNIAITPIKVDRPNIQLCYWLI